MDLRQQIAHKLLASYGLSIDPETEITVTLGATEAIYDAIQAVIGPGDEAIAFDPAYDSYEPAVRLAGGRCIRLPLMPPAFATTGMPSKPRSIPARASSSSTARTIRPARRPALRISTRLRKLFAVTISLSCPTRCTST